MSYSVFSIAPLSDSPSVRSKDKITIDLRLFTTVYAEGNLKFSRLQLFYDKIEIATRGTLFYAYLLREFHRSTS
jgi:hypothetical protein